MVTVFWRDGIDLTFCYRTIVLLLSNFHGDTLTRCEDLVSSVYFAECRRSFQAFVLTCNMHFIKKKTPIQCRHWATPNSKLRCKASCTKRSADSKVQHQWLIQRGWLGAVTVLQRFPRPAETPLLLPSNSFSLAARVPLYSWAAPQLTCFALSLSLSAMF